MMGLIALLYIPFPFSFLSGTIQSKTLGKTELGRCPSWKGVGNPGDPEWVPTQCAGGLTFGFRAREG